MWYYAAINITIFWLVIFIEIDLHLKSNIYQIISSTQSTLCEAVESLCVQFKIHVCTVWVSEYQASLLSNLNPEDNESVGLISIAKHGNL